MVAALLRAGASRSYLEYLWVSTNAPPTSGPEGALELFKAALWDTTRRRRGQVSRLSDGHGCRSSRCSLLVDR